MSSDSSLLAYERAYAALHPKQSIVPPSALTDQTAAPVREAGKESQKDSQKAWRETQDLLHKIQRYGVLACACGMKIKFPPDFDRKEMNCPKCGTPHPLPPELLAAMAAASRG
jgi:heat shock protein HtpX